MNSEVVVKAGYKGTVGKDGKPVVTLLTTTDKNSDWYKFNVGGNGTSTNPENPKPISETKVVPNTTTTTQNTGVTNTTVTTTGSSGGGTATVSEKPAVRSVTPKTINSTDGKTFIVITGVGFKQVKDAVMGELPVADFSVINDNSLQFHLNQQISPGTYDIQLILTDDSYINIPNAITVTSDTPATYRAINAY